MNNSNLVKKDFSAETITDLINGYIAAIVIHDFYPQTLCSLISKKLTNGSRKIFFAKAHTISKIKMFLCNALDTESFSNCRNEITAPTSQLRKIFHPYQSPADLLQFALDEVWSAESDSNNMYGRRCLVKVCGLMEKDRETRPHPDQLARDFLLGQIAANIYLKVPDKGEQLKLCFQEPDEPKQKKMRENAGSFFCSRNSVNLLSLVLKPKQGDLILFNTKYYYKTHKKRRRSPSPILSLSEIKMFFNFLRQESAQFRSRGRRWEIVPYVLNRVAQCRKIPSGKWG